MLKLLKHMKGYRAAAIAAPFFKVLEVIFELFIPLVMKNIIDIGIKNGDKSYILRMCGLLVLLGLVGFLCTMAAQFFAARAAVGFSGNIRSALFSHIQKLSFSDIDRLGTSSMITRMTSDVMQVQTGTNLILRLFSRSPVIVFGSVIMAFTVDTKSATVLAITVPLLCLVVFGILLAGIPQYKKVQGSLDRVLDRTRENLSGARVIRAFAVEKREIESFKKENDTLTGYQVFAGKVSSLLNPVTYLIINLAIVALLYTGALRVDGGYLTQGAVIALYNYTSQLLIELIKLANLIISVTRAIASADRIEKMLEDGGLPREILSAEKKDDSAVRFEHVSLTYGDAAGEALSDIDFSVSRGETVGIIGGTGSGKSSLVDLIPRFYDATKGEVRLDGVDVRAYSDEALRGKVGIVMQTALLFRGTIRDNIRFGKADATDEEIWQALATAQATEVALEKGGLDAMIEQGGKNLSGGQRQRLAIARTLVGNPDILIFDDSASALDLQTDAKLRAAVREMGKNHTVFIVSQRAASLFHADKILVLDDGKIAGIGSHEALLSTCPVYEEIYYSQFPKEANQ